MLWQKIGKGKNLNIEGVGNRKKKSRKIYTPGKHGITPSQIEGASFDGQYFHLNVPKHLMTKLNISETFISTWDPLYKIGVIENNIRKNKDFVWLVDLTDIYRKFSWGKIQTTWDHHNFSSDIVIEYGEKQPQ